MRNRYDLVMLRARLGPCSSTGDSGMFSFSGLSADPGEGADATVGRLCSGRGEMDTGVGIDNALDNICCSI